MRNRAFTLVELLIVIIILGVMAAIVVPKFTQSGLRSKQAARASNLKALQRAVDLFQNDTGAYPASLSDLAVTTAPANGINATGGTRPILSGTWRGPYIDKLVPDPITGTNYAYSTTPPVGKVSVPTVGGEVVVVGGGATPGIEGE